MRTLKLVIDRYMHGKTVRTLLISELVLSGTMIKRVKERESGIMLNGVRVHTNVRVKAGDVLEVEVGDIPRERPADLPAPEELPDICIRYSDDDLMIIEKPAGFAVHPGSLSRDDETVESIIIPGLEGGVFHPVNRLDRGTTGLMTVAKSGYIHDRLRRVLHTDKFIREYLAVVTGTPDPQKGRINLPIGRESAIKRRVEKGGAKAVTEYETVKTNGRYTLVRLFPETGRTHQIRVHMAAIGCPLVGDWLYGTEDRELIARPALHSSRICLMHPVTNTRLDIYSPLPEDMEVLMADRRRIAEAPKAPDTNSAPPDGKARPARRRIGAVDLSKE